MFEWYRRYRIRKTIARKYGEALLYIRPGYNVKNTMAKIALIHAQIRKLKIELKQ